MKFYLAVTLRYREPVLGLELIILRKQIDSSSYHILLEQIVVIFQKEQQDFGDEHSTIIVTIMFQPMRSGWVQKNCHICYNSKALTKGVPNCSC